MCRPTRCKTCDKTTWAGCGQHIAHVQAGVPADQWCPGGHSKAERASASRSSNGAGFLAKLFDRS